MTQTAPLSWMMDPMESFTQGKSSVKKTPVVGFLPSFPKGHSSLASPVPPILIALKPLVFASSCRLLRAIVQSLAIRRIQASAPRDLSVSDMPIHQEESAYPLKSLQPVERSPLAPHAQAALSVKATFAFHPREVKWVSAPLIAIHSEM